MFVVTGANGFIGQALVNELANRQHQIRAASRHVDQNLIMKNVEYRKAPSLETSADWLEILDGASIVIHTAARVHIMRGSDQSHSHAFQSINTHGTLDLAHQAANVGIKRFVFLSSIKVNGEETEFGKPFTESDAPRPSDAYAQSKLDAEIGLRQLGERSGMEIVILRLPLVYGAGVKGNFAAMIKILRLGVPLPFASIQNQRSMIGLANLIDVIIQAATHKDAKNKTLLVSDDADISTPALLYSLGRAIGSEAHLFRFPPKFLLSSMLMLGRHDIARRLLGSLQVDISEAKKVLSWQPPLGVAEGLEHAFRGYRHP